MSWKVIATVLTIVFMIVLMQSVLADPVVTVQSQLNASGDYSNTHFDGNDLIMDWQTAWFHMGLIAIFGTMSWGLWRVLRRELTRGRL